MSCHGAAVSNWHTHPRSFQGKNAEGWWTGWQFWWCDRNLQILNYQCFPPYSMGLSRAFFYLDNELALQFRTLFISWTEVPKQNRIWHLPLFQILRELCRPLTKRSQHSFIKTDQTERIYIWEKIFRLKTSGTALDEQSDIAAYKTMSDKCSCSTGCLFCSADRGYRPLSRTGPVRIPYLHLCEHSSAQAALS